MPSNIPPRTDCERLHPSLMVGDIPAAIDFYTTKLGFSKGFIWGEPPQMAGVNLNSVSIHLCLGEPVGNAVYFIVNDADELYEYQSANAVEIIVSPGDRDYELRDYAVEDPWGNRLSFGHYIQHTGPPLQIERVEIPVRIEKRLAGLLEALADYKDMTIGSCLEETLLHSFEQVCNDDAVASPHSRKTHAYIQELKRKFNIDYDTHASYRFREADEQRNEISSIG